VPGAGRGYLVVSPWGRAQQGSETALDVCGSAAHIAAQLGAHIIKVKVPSAHGASSPVETQVKPQRQATWGRCRGRMSIVAGVGTALAL
jgi:DhnA family fructose-bisphosphate aldolase class Ia